MTQIWTILEVLATITITWGSPIAALALVYAGYRRSQRRYHVASVRSSVPVQTFRTKGAARKASLNLYRQHGVAFRITTTR